MNNPYDGPVIYYVLPRQPSVTMVAPSGNNVVMVGASMIVKDGIAGV